MRKGFEPLSISTEWRVMEWQKVAKTGQKSGVMDRKGFGHWTLSSSPFIFVILTFSMPCIWPVSSR